jgi:hypothetical protein
VRCQDGAVRIGDDSCAGRNGFGLGEALPVGVTPGMQQVVGAADESGAKAVVSMGSGAEAKP